MRWGIQVGGAGKHKKGKRVVADKREEKKNEKVKRRVEGGECRKRGDEKTQTARPK